MRGIDPDVATCDLLLAIVRGEHPALRVEVQIMTPEQAKSYRFDPSTSPRSGPTPTSRRSKSAA
jgi:catalase